MLPILPICNSRKLFPESFSLEEKLADLRAGFLLTAREHVAKVQTLNQMDINEIESFFGQESLSTTLTDADLRISMTNVLSHMQAFNVLENQKKYRRDEFTKNSKSDDIPPFDPTNNGSRAIYPAARQALFAGTDAAAFSRLIALAKKPDTAAHIPLEDQLRPYQAKMILIGLLEQRIKERYPVDKKKMSATLDRFALTQRLRISTGTKGSPWENSSFHSGYVFGGDPEDFRTLFGNVSANNPTYSAGVDCSTFVQQILESLPLKDPKLRTNMRFTTQTLTDPDNQSTLDNVRAEPICSEFDLRPGDILVKRNHTAIFSGYDSENQPQVIEATGNPSRTVREGRFPIYRDDSPSSGCQRSALTENNWFVLRFDGALNDTAKESNI